MLTQPPPTIRRRIRAAYDRFGYRSFMFTGSMYLAAASLIGFETAAVLLSYVTMAPIAVPLTLAAIALIAVLRRRARRRARRRGTR